MRKSWYVEMLGGLSVRMRDCTLSKFRTAKDGELLAALACTLPQKRAREELIEILWPDVDMIVGRNRLRYTLSTLRAQMNRLGDCDVAPIHADRNTVWLEAGQVTTDVIEFERECDAAMQTDDPADKRARLESALARYQGELLPGIYTEYVLNERRRLKERSLAVQRSLFAILLAEGRADEALAVGLRLVRDAPLDARSHCLLMQAYAKTAQPNAVRAHFDEMRRLWRAELDEEPSQTVRQLMHKLIGQADAQKPDEIN